jgi:BlaI family transcriptional regulator, penicillinase repressor
LKDMPPRISAAEWEVMNVVWDRSPITATEVCAALPEGHGWAPKTVSTFLTRLVEKGALAVTREGKANAYEPRVKREQCVAAESESFLSRVFQGAAGPLVVHFVERAKLTTEEIRELERLLKAKKDRR